MPIQPATATVPTITMAIGDIEKALTELNGALRTALKTLGSDRRHELMQSLHSPDELPEKHLYDLSTEAVDLLQETKLLLEPRTVILADHFLGLSAAVSLPPSTSCYPKLTYLSHRLSQLQVLECRRRAGRARHPSAAGRPDHRPTRPSLRRPRGQAEAGDAGSAERRDFLL